MSSREIIHQLVCELAASLDLRQVTVCEQRAAWRLAGLQDLSFDLEFDAEEDRLMVSSTIGRVAPSAQPQLYALLLQYNALWAQTGGLRMALDSTTQQVLMLLEAPAAAQSAQRMRLLLLNMAQVNHTWRELLQAHSQAPCGEDARPLDPPMGPNDAFAELA